MSWLSNRVVNTVKFRNILSTFFAVSVLWGGAVQAEVQMTFGVYTSDNATAMVKKFRPVLDYLERSLSDHLQQPVRFRMQVAPTYQQGIESLVNGTWDIGRFGPASYVEAKRRNPNISIIAIESNKGAKIFQGLICVRSDSTITEVTQLKGKRFAFGDERSTIGRYLAQNYLARHGVTANDLEHFEYLGRHDKVGAAVAAGLFDAGALKEGTFKKLVKNGEPLRAIASFPNVTKPWLARSGLSPTVIAGLTHVLLGLKDETVLKALKKDGFLIGSEEDYAQIRVAIEQNGIFFDRTR